jgi:hypothetical protein
MYETVKRMIAEANIVAHYAGRFDRAHALRVLNPTGGKKYHVLAESAAHLVLEGTSVQ